MFPPKYAPALFGFILSGLMSLLVSGISTARAVGLAAHFPGLWATRVRHFDRVFHPRQLSWVI